MMYDPTNGFVLAILSGNKVLREINKEVFLPFGSEYKIRVKNPKLHRVGVKFFVDGTEISNGLIVLDPKQTFDLRRMIVDGDIDKGPKLVFESKNHSGIQDPTASDLGNVTVEFYSEQSRHISIIKSLEEIRCTNNTPDLTHLYSTNWTTSASPHDSQVLMSSTRQVGGTVPGAVTEQSFLSTNFECSSTADVTMTLKILGTKNPVYVQDTRNVYCHICGNKCKYGSNFCSSCGTKL